MSDAEALKQRRAKDNKRIPLYFVAFFVVLALLDGLFIYLATSTHTGVVTQQAYEQGLNYNRTVAQAEAAEALGWKITTDLKGEQFRATLRDAKGQPIEDAIVTATWFRPTQEGHDFTTPLAPVGEGVYAAEVTTPILGLWEVRVNATWQQQNYQHHQRLTVQP